MTVRTWVVGAGGLVGSAVARTPGLRAFPSAKIPWGTDHAPEVLGEELERFADWIGDDDWGIVWAAGAGMMLTTQADLDLELSVFESFCARLPGRLPQGRGGLYLVSSAGGVYAGSAHPPFDSATPPRPLNAYGRMKLAQEELAVETLASRIPVSIGRLSNVYGPGQDVFKQQGLVTQLALSALLNRPATIFAPLPTLRDYIYVDDAARLVVSDIGRMTRLDEPRVTRRVVSSGRAASIAELIAIVGRISGRTFPVIHRLADGPYFLDLRLQASDQVSSGQVTPLEAGVGLVVQDLVRQLADGRLAELV
ncbi:NAD-dependent epimerase/dehydratase family protein [Aeromicrobium sp.]|uniref:NAD-dependent epimerase/dehydratase family protein n=1 Tax=Aeromicrobium sp. TaxID=1871063 RepID=UPI002FC69F33